jgi:hypothetical protein
MSVGRVTQTEGVIIKMSSSSRLYFCLPGLVISIMVEVARIVFPTRDPPPSQCIAITDVLNSTAIVRPLDPAACRIDTKFYRASYQPVS